MLSAAADQISFWQVRLLMTVAQRGGRMRLNWDLVPPHFASQIGDLHGKGLLKAVEECRSDLEISGTVFLLSTDRTSQAIDDYKKSALAGRVPNLTPFGDDIQRIIKA